jgi:putative redox protein
MTVSATVSTHERVVFVSENGKGAFGQDVRVGAHLLIADEPNSIGGEGAGPDPFEYLLAGLGACTAMTIRLYAQRKNWPLVRVEVRLRHAERLAEGAERDVFSREITLAGDLSEAERQRLLEIAEKCPVSRTLVHGARIESGLSACCSPETGVSS